MMFKDSQVGDRVFDYLIQEWGEIISTTNLRPYTVLVRFEDGAMGSYTIQGIKNTIDKLPTLFWDEVKPITPPEKPLPELEVDTRVFVWDLNNKRDILKRYFSHFDWNGKIHCFPIGRTSWSSNGNTTAWDNWELAE